MACPHRLYQGLRENLGLYSLKYLTRRVVFHLSSGSAQIVLLVLTLANLTWAFPLALFGLAGLRLLLVVLEIVRTGPTVLATERP